MPTFILPDQRAGLQQRIERQVKIGVIGSGVWGSNHARALCRLGALAGVADRDHDRAQRLSGETHVPVMTFERMLEDPGIDGVVVALPPDLHPTFALQVLAADKHLLVEKPMALDCDQAQAIVHLARARRRVAMTGHVLRFHPAFEQLAALVHQGVFGPLRHIETSRLGMGQFFAAADALWDLAPHDLSLILALTGAPPVSERMDSLSLLAPGMIDSAHLHLSFAGGVTAHCHVSRLSPARKDRRLTATCDRGTLVFDDAEPWERKLAIHPHAVRCGPVGQVVASVDAVDYVGTPRLAPLDAELSHFLDCIASGALPVSDVAEGLAVLQIIERLQTDGALQSQQPGEISLGMVEDRVTGVASAP